MAIVRMTLEQIKKQSFDDELARLKAMDDAEIDFSDIPPLSDEQIAHFKPTKQQVTMRLDIAKIQQEINQNHEINMATIEKMKAETEKIQKETKFYPMLTFTMGIVAVIGGTVAAVITKLL